MMLVRLKFIKNFFYGKNGKKIEFEWFKRKYNTRDNNIWIAIERSRFQ